jgi:hypothetical protein
MAILGPRQKVCGTVAGTTAVGNDLEGVPAVNLQAVLGALDETQNVASSQEDPVECEQRNARIFFCAPRMNRVSGVDGKAPHVDGELHVADRARRCIAEPLHLKHGERPRRAVEPLNRTNEAAAVNIGVMKGARRAARRERGGRDDANELLRHRFVILDMRGRFAPKQTRAIKTVNSKFNMRTVYPARRETQHYSNVINLVRTINKKK